MRRNHTGFEATRVIGLILMVTGVIVLLCCIPEWLWASFIGIGLFALGFLCWRYG